MGSKRGMLVALLFALAASKVCGAQELPGDLLGKSKTEVGDYCECFVEGCECNVEFQDLAEYPHFFPSNNEQPMDKRVPLWLSVDIMCAVLYVPDANISSILVTAPGAGSVHKFRHEMRYWQQKCECQDMCDCMGTSERVALLSNLPFEPVVGSGLADTIGVTVSSAGTETLTCPSGRDVPFMHAYVRVAHVTVQEEDLATRLLLGIVFALVWTVIMVVPIVMWIRRRRAYSSADPRAFGAPTARGHARNGARDHGIRAKPRRFKVVVKTDWDGDPGVQRRNIGWILADEEIVKQAITILEKDVTVMGRGAPTVVVASMQGDYWAKLTRPPERGQPRTVELSATVLQRPPEQAVDWVLITLPQSVRYASGVSGEIHIDIFGNVIPWEGTRETGEFRKKVDRLRRALDRSRRPRFGRDRDEVPVQVSRAELFESSFMAVTSLAREDLSRRFKVAFVGEDGSDFGGVRREWYSLVTQEIVKPELGMFEPTDGDEYSYQLATHIDTKGGHEAIVGPQTVVWGQLEVVVDHLSFAGKMLAKCIVDNQLCSVNFTAAVYKMLLLQPFVVEDLESVDRDMYNSLEWVLESNCDEEDLGMFMCVDTTDTDGNHVTIELIEGGKDIPVTEENKTDFVNKMMQWRLVDRVAVQADALVAGFHSVLPLEYLEAFTAAELELLLCGSVEVDLDDWKINTLYKSGYSSDSEIVKWLWDIVDSMKNDDRLRLLQFVTGTSSIPSRGFAHLQGSDGERRFSIMRVVDTSRLPQAHTCFNELVLPEYETKEELADKLTVALQHLEDGMLLR